MCFGLVILATVSACLLASTGCEANDSESLVLHYTFDEATGDIVRDHSAWDNHGKIHDCEYLENLNGRSGVLRFNGEASYVDCGDADSLHFGGDMSLEMWVRLNQPVKNPWGYIFGDAPIRSFYFTFAHYHTLMLYYRTGSENMALPVQREIIGDEWSHVAVVVEYPRCRFYHNGALVRDAFMPVPGIVKLQKAAKHIGGAEGSFCPIDLDELRFYRRALAEEEVAAHAAGREATSRQAEELLVEPDWYRDALNLRLVSKGRDCTDHVAEMTLLRGDRTEAAAPRRVAMAESSEGSGRYVGEVTFPLAPVANEAVDAVARLIGPGGEPVTTVHSHQFLDRPQWIRTREGRSDEVLPPWTPVEAEARADGAVAVRVWGRRYDIGPAPFLRQIETRERQILASPMTLTGKLDGRAMQWADGRVRLEEFSETAAVVRQVCENDAATLRVSTRGEYDGYMIFDCELEASRDLSMQRLTLDIPLKRQHATLCYGDRVLPEDPEIPISAWYSGALAEDQSFRFSPCIWLGDEERGLCWQAESDEQWRYADEQNAIEILVDDETTTFRAHLVDVPTSMREGEALHYRFALLATPVKPLTRDAWDLRIVRSEPYGADLDLPDRQIKGEPALQRYADMGVRHLFVNVNDMWPYPMPLHDRFSRALHGLIDATHARGLRLYPYAIHQRFPVMAPEFDLYGLRMAQRPLQSYVPGGGPLAEQKRPGPITTKYAADSQGTVFMCAKSEELRDAWIHSLARRLDEYGDDGVYLDGTCHVPPCRNVAHGCGYRALDGTVRPTYPVFAVRELMRRIYTVVKRRRPDGVVDVHCSWGYNPAALAYADVLWTGEQWHHLRKTKTDYVAGELSLDQFRTEFMGYQLGVAAETLPYRLGPRMKVAATSLLHDIPVRINTADEEYFDTIARLWQVRDRFGAAEAQRLFYWENHDYVQVSPQGSHATLLTHPRNGVLALVANLNRETQTVAVQFDLNRLGLQGRELGVSNALTGEGIDMAEDGALSLSLESEEWVYIWLQPTRTDDEV